MLHGFLAVRLKNDCVGILPEKAQETQVILPKMTINVPRGSRRRRSQAISNSMRA
jgi:hypothetical protein